MVKPKRRRLHKTKSISWGLLVFEAVGWIVLAGMLLGIYEANKAISVVQDARPVAVVTADTTGIVRLEGLATGEEEIREQGILRQAYALLQKEPFIWTCGRGCDYKLAQGAEPKASGSIKVNGVEIQADRYLFYKTWLPLNRETVEDDQLFRIYEGGSARPLLVEEHDRTAYGYRAVSSGERITVIGNVVNGRIEPYSFSGKKKPATVLIGDTAEQMIAAEKEARTGYTIVGLLALLPLSVVMIGRLRRKAARKPAGVRQREG